MTTVISPTLVNDMHSINYIYPLTINDISLSDAGQYSCTARIRSNGINNVMNSDIVDQDTIVNLRCEFIYITLLLIICVIIASSHSTRSSSYSHS